MKTFGIGGTPNLGRYFQCVGSIRRDGMRVGSCVLVGKGCIAVTASHVVDKPHVGEDYSVVFRRLVAGAPVDYSFSVDAIYWASGEVYRTGAGNWPTVVGGYNNDNDRLALLVLKAEVGASVVDTPARFAGAASPAAGDFLLISGTGELEDGTLPHLPWVCTSRYRPELAQSGFLAHLAEPRDPLTGIPSGDDSGGGVFWPPMSDPMPPNHLRIVGVHSGRDPDDRGEERVGRAIPIDPRSQEWIRRIESEHSQRRVSSDTSPKQTNVAPKGAIAFKWRNYYDCFTVDDPVAMLDGASLRLATKGRELMLSHRSWIRTSIPGSDLELTLEIPNRGKNTITLKPHKVMGEIYWYTNDTGTNDAYYLLLRTKEPKKQDRPRGLVVHIEAFAAGSGTRRPSMALVSGSRPAAQVDDPDAAYGVIAYIQDQDDEGTGYEG